MIKKLNIAYVGFGKSTNRYHIPYVKERENIVIKRIVNRTLGKRPEQAELEANGTLFSTDIADIINDDSIDLVVIVTPALLTMTMLRNSFQLEKMYSVINH